MKEKWLHELKIGNVVLKNNLILGPMAGVTDLPFRLLCSEQGAGLTGMEMVSAKAIMYGNKNTDALMEIHPEEGPAALQLFGSDPDIISRMAHEIEERPFQILDLNMGCPVPKVVNNGEGSALMKNPGLVEEIVRKTVAAIRKPVSVKIRKGFDDAHVNAVEVAQAAEAGGASAVAVHGRTREQYYAGEADWDIIGEVKRNVKIPVIGSGDVTDGMSARRMLEYTGCDGVMIARGARGNPWIFREVSAFLEHGTVHPRPDSREIHAMILRHARMLLEYKGEYIGIREMRKHVSWYTTGLPHSARIRKELHLLENLEALETCLEQIFPQ